MPRLLVLIASTRPVRVGRPIGDWFASRAREHDGFELDVVDLKELDLPMMNEEKHPRFGEYALEHTQAWAKTVAAADAFVFVMPEYNHGYTAPLKNAIDYLHAEWRHKPVGFVSYGGVAGGTRAIQLLKPVCAVLDLVPVNPQVNVPFVFKKIEDGVFTPDEHLDGAASAMLDALVAMESALRSLR